jgi:signal transduction histidine kinase
VELLDVARIDTGGRSTRGRSTSPAVGRCSPRSGRAPGARSSRRGSDLPQVFADPDKFVQVVTNLVENAVRHGDGVVRITLEPLGGDTPYPGVRMHVDDEGDGISPDIRTRVFTKFWKHGTRGGSGLGMYIVHGLVTAHGGSIEIGDAPGGDFRHYGLRHGYIAGAHVRREYRFRR